MEQFKPGDWVEEIYPVDGISRLVKLKKELFEDLSALRNMDAQKFFYQRYKRISPLIQEILTLCEPKE